MLPGEPASENVCETLDIQNLNEKIKPDGKFVHPCICDSVLFGLEGRGDRLAEGRIYLPILSRTCRGEDVLSARILSAGRI